MTDRLLLERVFMRSEFNPRFPAMLTAVGMLLGYALGRNLRPNPRIDEVMTRLDRLP